MNSVTSFDYCLLLPVLMLEPKKNKTTEVWIGIYTAFNAKAKKRKKGSDLDLGVLRLQPERDDPLDRRLSVLRDAQMSIVSGVEGAEINLHGQHCRPTVLPPRIESRHQYYVRTLPLPLLSIKIWCEISKPVLDSNSRWSRLLSHQRALQQLEWKSAGQRHTSREAPSALCVAYNLLSTFLRESSRCRPIHDKCNGFRDAE